MRGTTVESHWLSGWSKLHPPQVTLAQLQRHGSTGSIRSTVGMQKVGGFHKSYVVGDSSLWPVVAYCVRCVRLPTCHIITILGITYSVLYRGTTSTKYMYHYRISRCFVQLGADSISRDIPVRWQPMLLADDLHNSKLGHSIVNHCGEGRKVCLQ